MEAEVLSPRPMMADVNGNSKMTNAELEVLKLQELVRKLEKQNEQLRTRANAVNNCSSGGPHPHPHPLHPHNQQQQHLHHIHGEDDGLSETLSCTFNISSPVRSLTSALEARSPSEEPFAYFQPSSASPDAAEEQRGGAATAGGGGGSGGAGDTTVLDGVDVLDLNVVLPVGEPDSWLYVSNKSKQRCESILTPLQWCRQVLDHPGPEVELARMTLSHRLDQAKRRRGLSSIRPFSCIEGLSTLSCPVLPYTKSASLTEPTVPVASSDQPAVPLRTSSSLSDRAPTFLSNTALHSSARRHAALSPQSSLDSDAGVSELDNDTISMGYKLQDMTDVEVMARLQEESLRQDYNASTSNTASRRSSSLSLHSLRRSALDLEEEEEEDEGYDQLPPPQPELFPAGSMQRTGLSHSHTFSSIRDCRRSLTTSQFSLSGLSQFSGPSSLLTDSQASYRNSTDKLRKSMPNLLRTPSMPSVPSMPCLVSPVNPPSHGPSSLPTIPSLRSSQSFDSSSGLARLQSSSIPSPGSLSQRVQSVTNFSTTPRHTLKATAYVSPTVQQGPTNTSLSSSTSLHSIPSSTALPQPLKPSSILAPQTLKSNSNQQPCVPRSSLPRPASFVGTGALRASKLTPPTRSLLTPPKSLSTLSALRDGSWKDGCY